MFARHAVVLFSSACLWALSAGLATELSGCTDAGKCLRGAPGCPCTQDGTCTDSDDEDGDDVVCNRTTFLCEMAAGDRDAGPPPEVECTGDTVAEVCGKFCDALCENQTRFCFDSTCGADACSAGGEVSGPCTQQCDTVACARELCMNQVDETMTCETFGFEADGEFINLCLDADPLCVPMPELGCTNTCGTSDGVDGQLVANDRCEDGHDEDSVSSRCPRGTDCEDCGPHPCVAPGDECVNHGDCCGFFGPGALCVDPDGPERPRTPYCLVTCDTSECDDGFTCTPTLGAGSVCVAD